jgi:GNAT superfamily N-acetyltransferase
MKIRLAKLQDAPAISRVHIESWKTTYRGIVPDKVLDDLDCNRNTIRWYDTISAAGEMKCLFVAETDINNVVGFAIGGPNRTDNTAYNGELYAIYMLKEHQGKGIGKALLLEIACWLSRHNYTSMLVWVLAKNPARYFYEALGAIPVGKKSIEIGNTSLEEVSYGWPDITNLFDQIP